MSKFDKNNKRDNEQNPNKKKQEFEKNREIGGQKNQGKDYRSEGSGPYQGRNEERQRGFEQGKEPHRGFEKGKDEKNKYDQDRKDKDQGFGKKRKSA